jgi:prepilin-type processing-associated H-X9-DG protein
MQYTQDYDEHFFMGVPNSAGAGWGGAIFPYVKSIQVFKCPSDNTPLRSQAGWTVVSYAVNAGLTNPANINTFSGGTLSKLNASAKTVMMMEVAYTGGTLANGSESGYISPSTWGVCRFCQAGATHGLVDRVGHSDGYYATGHMSGAGRTYIVAANPLMNIAAMSDTDAGQLQYQEGRHLDGANFLMTDGHVKWLKGSAVSTGWNALTETSAQDDTALRAEGSGYSGADAHAVTFSPI